MYILIQLACAIHCFDVLFMAPAVVMGREKY